MDRALFIGDEVTATGYRLAGLAIRTPAPSEITAVLEAVRNDPPPLVLLTAEFSQHLEAAELERLLSGVRPPVQLVEDAAGRVPVPDLAARIRTRIGVSQ